MFFFVESMYIPFHNSAVTESWCKIVVYSWDIWDTPATSMSINKESENILFLTVYLMKLIFLLLFQLHYWDQNARFQSSVPWRWRTVPVSKGSADAPMDIYSSENTPVFPVSKLDSSYITMKKGFVSKFKSLICNKKTG